MFWVLVRLKKFIAIYLKRQPNLVLEVQPYLFVFNLATFRAFFALFGPFGAIFLVVVRFRNFFGTYLCRQSTLVFDVQPFHFVFNSDTFGATFALFSGPSGGYFFGLFKLFFRGLGQVRKYF